MKSVVRGVCPTCASGEVTHILWGFQILPPAEDWIELGGCIVEDNAHNRVCQTCAHEWTVPYGKE